MSASVVSPHARRHPMSVVTQARRHGKAGWSPRKITKFLAEDGITVSERTVARWVDPALQERDRLRDEQRARRAAAQRSGRLATHITNPTVEFKFARMRSLSELPLSHAAIAKVMAFDFGDFWLDKQNVRYALESGRYPQEKST